MLSPNALRFLDSLGIYERIRTKGFNFETLEFQNESGEKTDTHWFGSERLYGYKALRIYRQVLVNEFKLMLKQFSTPIKYESKYSHVISESEDEVLFGLTDGSTVSTSLLIGADGIHSKVRRHIFSSVELTYSGHLGITSAISRSKLRLPSADYHLPVSISAKPGVFVMAPQDVDGSEILVGVQHVMPGRDRTGWEELGAAKGELLDLLKKDMKAWPDVVQSALENITMAKIGIWPFYMVPRLETWMSVQNKVVILGDAAHAIPPWAGQGVNQAFEDVYMLSLLLSKLSSKIPLSEALHFWQTFRQKRVDEVSHLTRKMNAKRLGPAEQAKLAEEEIWKDDSKEKGEGRQLRWLYEVDVEKDVSLWVQQQEQGH